MAKSPNLIQAILNSNMTDDDKVSIMVAVLREECSRSPEARKLILEYGKRRGWTNQSPEPNA